MPHDDETPLPPRGCEPIDEWIEQHALGERPLRPDDGREPPAPPLIQELEDFYHEEAQAVEHRLEHVWRRLEARAALPEQRQPRGLSLLPNERNAPPMRNPSTLLRAPRRWATRLSALAAAVLLVALVAGLVLVRHGNKTTATSQGPTATAISSPTPTAAPAPNALSFSTIAMKDANNGWATAIPNPYMPGATEQILHTSDGGVHWKNVTPKSSALLAQSGNALARPLSNGASVRPEDFVNGSVAWLLILPNHLFNTSDGGQTWHQETAPGNALRQFTFLDAQHGWAIAEDAGSVVTFRTTDGAAHWTRMPAVGGAFQQQDAFLGLSFLNATAGWAPVINNTAGNSAFIYHTQNGGATWQRQQIAMPPGVIAPIFPFAPIFFNDHEGMMEVFFNGVNGLQAQAVTIPASGGSPEGLYVTHNGGASWQGPIILTGLEFPNFIDVLHGWALNSTGSGLLTTSDSGRHWTPLNTSPNFSEMSNPNFVSSQIGWALKYDPAGGFLLKTEDGGTTWIQLDTSISN